MIARRTSLCHRASLRAALLLTTMLAGASAPALAGEDAIGIEEIVVTAQKRAQNLQRTPISITAFTAENLAARGLTNIGEIGDFTPNMEFDFTAPISGSSNASSIFIRGIGQTDFLLTTDPGVGLYLDGVYVSRSIGGVLDLLDLERVEVLRGPQGTLFGRNTIGGAISLITKKPADEFSGSGEITMGRYSRLDVRASVNFVIAKDVLFARLSASSKNRDGYGERLITGEGMGNENSDSARAALRWLAGDNFEVNVAADYTRAREQSPPSTLVFIGPDPATSLTGAYNFFVAPTNTVEGFGNGVPYDSRFFTDSDFTNYGTGPTGSDLDVWGVSVTLDWSPGALHIKSITAYRELDSQFGRDPDGSPIEVVHTSNVINHQQFSQELNVSGIAFDERLNWVVGAYYFDESGDDTVTVPILEGLFTTPADPVFGVPNPLFGVPLSIAGPVFVDNTSFALFAQGTFAITDAFSATAGVRYTRDKKKVQVDQKFTQIDMFILANRNASESFDDVTPHVSLDYQWTPDVLTYVSFSQGFKSGGFTGRYVIPTAAPRPFDPEKVTTYEAGLKAELFARRLRFNAAVFYTDYKNIQLVIFDGVAPQTRNAAKATVKGFEAEFTAIPFAGLTLSGGLGYLDAQFDRFDPLANQGLVIPLTLDDKFVNTPKWSLNLAAEYSFAAGNAGFITLRGDYTYRSTVANDAINTPSLIQDGFGLLGARAAFTAADGQWELALFGRNLTNKHYIVSGVADVPSFGLAEANFARPREWGLSLKFTF